MIRESNDFLFSNRGPGAVSEVEAEGVEVEVVVDADVVDDGDVEAEVEVDVVVDSTGEAEAEFDVAAPPFDVAESAPVGRAVLLSARFVSTVDVVDEISSAIAAAPPKIKLAAAN